MLSPGEMVERMDVLSRQGDAALAFLKAKVMEHAEAEAIYRAAKAEAWVLVRDKDDIQLAAERQAWVEAHTAQLRKARDIALGLRQAALEAIRWRRGQLSSLQTTTNAFIEEAKFVRGGPS